MLDTPERLDAASARSRGVAGLTLGTLSEHASRGSRALRYCYACASRRTTRLAADTSLLVQTGDVVGADRGACVHEDRVVGVVDRSRVADCTDPVKAAVRREHPGLVRG